VTGIASTFPAHRRSPEPEPGHAQALPHIPAPVIVAAVLLSAGLLGRLLADGRIKYGVAVVLVASFAPLVLFDLAAALAVWVAVQFFQDLTILSSAPNAIGVLVGLGWIGASLGRKGKLAVLRDHRRLLVTVALMCMWFALTIAWSQRAGPAGTEVGYWGMAALVFLVTLTTLTNSRETGYVMLAFVAGSVVSVLIGLATGSLNPAASATAVSQTAIQGRFTGGGGDPNVQAAGFVATMFLIVGLLSVHRRRAVRVGLLLAFALVTVGFLATQSRGGLLALAAGTIAALVISPRHRRRILAMVAIVCVTVGAFAASHPGALQRITDLGGGTSGRNDLWRVGWQVFTGHPLVGVGIGNFQVVEAHYVLGAGSISRIAYLTDVPYFVHNTYLQLLAESGIIGLLGFLLLAGACMRAAWLAAARFDSLGRADYADLARAVLMGTIGMLVALFFITDGNDMRLWVLLAIGPVLLSAAARASPAAPQAASHRPPTPRARARW
jgi:O-antigen ligase